MHGTVATEWTDCGGTGSQWSCTAENTLTFTIPAGHCGAGRIGVHTWATCSGSDLTITLHDGVVAGENAASMDATVCLDTLSLSDPQCAHWRHVAWPRPHDPANPTGGSGGIIREVVPQAIPGPYTPPAGFGIA